MIQERPIPIQMIHNLADDPAYSDVLKHMRKRLHDWMIETRDLGLINERLLYERAKGRSLWERWSGYRELRDSRYRQPAVAGRSWHG